MGSGQLAVGSGARPWFWTVYCQLPTAYCQAAGPSFAAPPALSDGKAARHYNRGARVFRMGSPCGSVAGVFC
jgi:hypothetical protein